MIVYCVAYISKHRLSVLRLDCWHYEKDVWKWGMRISRKQRKTFFTARMREHQKDCICSGLYVYDFISTLVNQWMCVSVKWVGSNNNFKNARFNCLKRGPWTGQEKKRNKSELFCQFMFSRISSFFFSFFSYTVFLFSLMRLFFSKERLRGFLGVDLYKDNDW